jgi:hypothetical protein
VASASTDNIAAVKRQLTAAAAALFVIASGALASACDVTPPAASANGTTISTGSFNAQLYAMVNTVPGSCLLQLENAQATPATAQGAGGPGTYNTGFTGEVLSKQLGDLLGAQYAASKGITISASDLAQAKTQLQSTLGGEIDQLAQEAEQAGIVSACTDISTGSNLTGTQLLSGLPSAVAADQIRNEAVDQKLLARGADISNAAVAAYYHANLPLFTASCVSTITTDTQAHANQIVAMLQSGSSFATLAGSSTLGITPAANGGALGCNIPESEVEQSLNVKSVTVGQPIPPLQNPQTGQWSVYEVTSQQVASLQTSEGVAREELLQSTANVKRVSNEIVAFARHSDVTVDPQYGEWKGLTVIPPVAPPARYLLAAVSGEATGSLTPKSLSPVSGSGTPTTTAPPATATTPTTTPPSTTTPTTTPPSTTGG